MALICCSTPAQHKEKSALRRMLYVVPDALPGQYDWKPLGNAVNGTVWFGTRLDAQGHLGGAERLFSAMEIHSWENFTRNFTRYLLITPENEKAAQRLLSDTRRAQRSFTAIAGLLQKNNSIAGVQLDFEYLPVSFAEKYVAFARGLKQHLPAGRTLHIAVFPPIGMPQQWSGFHKLAELAAVSDGLFVMLYDYHRPGSKPGCVSGISWLRKNARQLALLPREKIWLGAPLYGYRFAGHKTTAISRSGFTKLKRNRTEADGCLLVETAAGVQSYYPAAALYAEYDALVRENGFAGVAYWRAGFER